MTAPTHDLQIEPEPNRVAAFFAATREVVLALADGAELISTTRLTHPHAGAWHSITPEEIAGPFVARVDFATRGIVGRFVFGDRESASALSIAQAQRPRATYHVNEWVAALGSTPAPDSGFNWLLTVRRVQAAVTQYGTLLLSHAEGIAAAKLDTFAQMDALRSVRLETEAASWRARDQERDEYAAAAAFRAGDWARVSEVLSAHEAELSAAQTMKLTLARKRAGATQGS